MMSELGQGGYFMTAEMPQIPHGSVIITPEKMYDVMQSTRDEVRHLNSIVDPAMNELRSDIAENKNYIHDLDRRMREQEAKAVVTPKAMWGGLAVVLAALTLAASIFVAILD